MTLGKRHTHPEREAITRLASAANAADGVTRSKLCQARRRGPGSAGFSLGQSEANRVLTPRRQQSADSFYRTLATAVLGQAHSALLDWAPGCPRQHQIRMASWRSKQFFNIGRKRL